MKVNTWRNMLREPKIKVLCKKCGWVDESTVEFVNIEEDMQGRDVLTFVCKCGLPGESLRTG